MRDFIKLVVILFFAWFCYFAFTEVDKSKTVELEKEKAALKNKLHDAWILSTKTTEGEKQRLETIVKMLCILHPDSKDKIEKIVADTAPKKEAEEGKEGGVK